ncbi:hypothetical protein CCACVL1_17846 [Corchorus capsularis]|uniref:Uncharacterized protein n=1 Tax=Corchorus capsularis TaxID=210143 RepID=A0A1R3HQE3_COCAP|nr:hypothetical protein CCACVL1_17846 [Corchorus capsularis]
MEEGIEREISKSKKREDIKN